MDSLIPKFVYPVPDLARRRAIEEGAGIYLIGRDFHFATPGSRREQELVAAGAPRVGTLRFDPDATERSHPHPVRAVRGAEAARIQLVPARN